MADGTLPSATNLTLPTTYYLGYQKSKYFLCDYVSAHSEYIQQVSDMLLLLTVSQDDNDYKVISL